MPSTANLKVELNKTVVVGATVDQGDQGVVRLDEEVLGSRGFRAAQLQKYPNGQRLELTFKLSGTQKRILIGVTELYPEDRWYVSVTLPPLEALEEQALLVQLAHLAGRQLKWSDSDTVKAGAHLKEAVARDGYPTPLSLGMKYETATGLQRAIEAEYPEVIVTRTKHTLEDMPELIEESQPGKLEWLGDFWVPDDLAAAIPLLTEVISAGGILNMMFVGESGYGKTTAAKSLAEYLGLDFVRVNVGTITDPVEWFGFPEARDATTFFNKTEFTEKMERGHVVCLLDEVNRAEAWKHNSLMSILDDGRSIDIRGYRFEVGPAVLFIGTKNVGLQYVGTFETDAALDNRFALQCEFPAPPVEIEVQILRKVYPDAPTHRLYELVRFMSKLRNYTREQGVLVDVTTRTSKTLTGLLLRGMSLPDAVRLAVINKVPQHQRKSLFDLLAAQVNQVGERW